jgi:hypothetical protein
MSGKPVAEQVVVLPYYKKWLYAETSISRRKFCTLFWEKFHSETGEGANG